MGTVQIGVPYGRKAHLGLCEVEEAEEILEAGWFHGIRAFDTAVGYGQSILRLANWLGKKGEIASADIITKIPVLDCGSKQTIEKAGQPFAGARSITILTHGFVPEEQWKLFAEHCLTFGFIPGQSVYSAEEIRACGKMGVNKVQAPGNVLDLNQIQAGAEHGIELDIRSIFLQGTLLADPVEAEKRVPGLLEVCELIQQMAKSYQVSKVSLLINGVIAFCLPSMRLVVGADKPHEISEWIKALEEDHSHGMNLIRTIRENFGDRITRAMIDPRLWK
jgi:aryl-alcohol dehydrogenase-like predicted oxidoreductase